MTLPDAAQAAAQPRVAQRGVGRNGAVKPRLRRADVIFCREQKSFQRERFRVARGQRQTFIQRLFRLAGVAKTEFQFRDPRPGEAKLRRGIRGAAGEFERGRQRCFAARAGL